MTGAAVIDELRAELARTDLPPVTEQKLRKLLAVLEKDSQARLESLAMVDPGPHAVVSFGDIEAADLVIFVLHGIDTDLAHFPEWADAAQRLCVDVIRSCVARGEPRNVAVIAWFAWDSGTHVSALATKHATVGAARTGRANRVEVTFVATAAPRPAIEIAAEPNPNQSGAVMYEPMADGTLKLVAVEYITAKGPASLGGQLFSFNSAPNRYGLGPFYELHVWAWKANPTGTFADNNPNVSCEAAAAK